MKPLILLQAAHGQIGSDIEPMLLCSQIFGALLLGCWMLGYWMGSRVKAAVLGGTLGCGLAVAVTWALTFHELRWVISLAAMWIWCWSAVGYAGGARYSRPILGGFLGGFMGPIGLQLFLALTIIDLRKSSD